MREAIEAAGATLRYLPPYSPDLNPIELLFAKLKVLLRKAAERESKRSGPGSARSWTPLPGRNALLIFAMPATLQIDRNLL